MTINEQARRHSTINRYAWVLTNGTDTYYTDSEELVSRDQDKGYCIIAEYIEGYQTDARGLRNDGHTTPAKRERWKTNKPPVPTPATLTTHSAPAREGEGHDYRGT